MEMCQAASVGRRVRSPVPQCAANLRNLPQIHEPISFIHILFQPCAALLLCLRTNRTSLHCIYVAKRAVDMLVTLLMRDVEPTLRSVTSTPSLTGACTQVTHCKYSDQSNDYPVECDRGDINFTSRRLSFFLYITFPFRQHFLFIQQSLSYYIL